MEASEKVVLAEKVIGAPKRHGSVYTGVEANVPTLPVCYAKISLRFN